MKERGSDTSDGYDGFFLLSVFSRASLLVMEKPVGSVGSVGTLPPHGPTVGK
jgi:hypothetical protein